MNEMEARGLVSLLEDLGSKRGLTTAQLLAITIVLEVARDEIGSQVAA